MLIGIDYHPSFQQIAFLGEATGEYSERRLNHSDGEVEKVYRDLKLRGVQVQVGMEATGYSRWFERLLAELDFEVWIGDPAEIQARRVKKQKTDRRCATAAAADGGRSLSADLGAESAESRYASTAVAPASASADAHANHESAAGAGDERRISLEEKTVQRTRPRAVRKAGVGALGQSAPARVVGVTGSIASDDRRTHCCCAAGSQEAARGSSVDFAFVRGSAYSPRVCIDRWKSKPISSWQADRQLRGDDS